MYYISKHEQNCWHTDGTPIIPYNYLETTKWKDVLKWFHENKYTTAVISAYLWVDNCCWGKLNELIRCSSINDNPRLKDVKEYIEDMKHI